MSREVRTLAARAAMFLALSGLVVVAQPGRASAQSESAPDLSAGLKVYTQICLGCHAEGGNGNPGVIPPLDGSEFVNSTPERLINIIIHGLTGPVMVAGEQYNGLMPPWGAALKDEEIAAVASYIRGSWSNYSAAITPAQVTAIRDASKARTTPWTLPELLAATPDK